MCPQAVKMVANSVDYIWSSMAAYKEGSCCYKPFVLHFVFVQTASQCKVDEVLESMVYIYIYIYTHNESVVYTTYIGMA